MDFGEDRPPEALGQYTGFLLNWVAAGSRRRFDTVLEDVGLRRHDFALLNVVADQPGLTQQELVGETHIDPSTMVQTLDSLAEAGLAERKPHPTDRRKHTIHLTTAGRAKLKCARAAATRAGEESFERLNAEELAQLHASLRKLAGYED